MQERERWEEERIRDGSVCSANGGWASSLFAPQSCKAWQCCSPRASPQLPSVPAGLIGATAGCLHYKCWGQRGGDAARVLPHRAAHSHPASSFLNGAFTTNETRNA